MVLVETTGRAMMSEPTATWTDLVGRADQQRILLSFLSRAAHAGAALSLSGPSGVGRSVLMSATVQAAASAGYVVLAGSGSESEAGMPFATLNQVLLPAHDVIAGLDLRDREVLAGALGLGPAGRASTDQVAGAVVAAVARVDPRAPVLIAVDDLQWADPSSAAVLAALAHWAVGRRIAVLVAHRSDELLYPDVSAFETLPVPPLDQASASALLSNRSPALASSVRERVRTEAQGNPLALIELPAAMTARQRSGQDRPAILPLNARLRTPFERRVLQVAEPARYLLLVAALDDRGSLPVLAAALRQTETHLAAGDDLAAAIRSGLATTNGDGDGRSEHLRVVFRHPLVRATIVAMASIEDRQRAHQALALAYAACPQRRAHHLAAAATRPDAAVADLLEATAFSGLHRGDAVAGLSALVRAGELSPLVADRRRRLAQAAYLAADVTGDLTLASTLLAELRFGHPAPRNTVYETLAAAHVLFVRDGDADTAHRLLVAALRAWAGTEVVDTRPLLAVLRSLLRVCLYSARPEFWPPLRAAVAEFGELVPADLRLLVEVLSDPARVAPAVLAELDAAVARLRDDETDPVAIERIAATALFVDRVGACEPAIRRLIDQSRSSGAVATTIDAAMMLWGDEFHRGRWDSAAALLAQASALSTQHGLSLSGAPVRYGQAVLAAVRGDDGTTQRLAGEISAWAAPRGVRGVQHLGWHARALSAIGRGDFGEAHRLFGLIAPTGVVPGNVPVALWMIFDVVEAAVRSGHRSEAVAQVGAWQDLGVADISARLAVAVTGAAALAAPSAQAGALFEAALAVPGAGDWPFDLARVRLAYGEHLRRQRKIMRARGQLGTALSELRALSAWPWAARAAVELRAAQAPAPGPGRMLTPQQQEISALAGVGLSNKQIAQRLQLSPRTVAAHLRQVYPKLGIASRGALHDAMHDAMHGGRHDALQEVRRPSASLAR